LRPAAQVRVILRILVVELDNVVVDVGDGRHGHAVEAELLELEARHRPGRILEQNLVDTELELVLAPTGQVVVDDLLRERLPRHRAEPNLGCQSSSGSSPPRCSGCLRSASGSGCGASRARTRASPRPASWRLQ